MTESLRSCYGLLVQYSQIPRVAGAESGCNTASRRISEKSGMRIVALEEHDYVSGRLPTEIWEITAEEWNARRR